jgi:hypothetical protein
MAMTYDPVFVTLTQRLRDLIVEVRGDNVPRTQAATEAAA